jgi:hypothetical protein
MVIAKSINQDPRPKSCRPIDPQLIEQMRTMVRKKTGEGLAEQFGVGYDTWRKLIAGAPVRTSLVDRLEARLRQFEPQ